MILDRFKVLKDDEVHVSEEALRTTVTAIFEKMGVPPEDAAIGADVQHQPVIDCRIGGQRSARSFRCGDRCVCRQHDLPRYAGGGAVAAGLGVGQRRAAFPYDCR